MNFDNAYERCAYLNEMAVAITFATEPDEGSLAEWWFYEGWTLYQQ